MSYRVLIVGVPNFTMFNSIILDTQIIYEPKRAYSVDYVSPKLVTHLNYGYSIACF